MQTQFKSNVQNHRKDYARRKEGTQRKDGTPQTADESGGTETLRLNKQI